MTRAKLLWHNGELSKAIDELSGTNHRESRLREFYEAEREVFGGWRPQLEKLVDYSPIPNVVLHLLTNSLPHTESGYTQRSHSILLEQAKSGVEVHAVTRLGYPQSIGVPHSHGVDIVDGIKYHRLALDGPRKNLRDHHQQEAEQLLDLIHTIRPSVIHTTTHFVNGLVAGAVSQAAGIPWIYEIRGQLSDTWASKRGPESINSERYISFKREELAVARSADAVITIGEQMKNLLISRDIESHVISMSPNAVGEAFLASPQVPRTVRAEMGLEEEPIFVGTVSSLVDYEGLETLIQAYAMLRSRRDDVRLLIVGDGAASRRLRREALSLGLDPTTIFTGRVPREQAVKYHQALDIFVVPRQDLLVTRAVTPLKPVEAMAMERPVVASDLPALREIVTHGVTGTLVPPGDPEQLAKALEELVENAELRFRMGRAGRQSVLLNRTWSTSVQASLKLYKQFSERNANTLDD
ncbi:glycosyltransferase [Neomicrococcus lactis]